MSRLDVGFVPVDRPGHGGTGSVYASTLLIERLSRHHDLTVYVVAIGEVDRKKLPATDRVTYVIDDTLSHVPHGLWNEDQALRDRRAELEGHDLVHSYASTINPLAGLDTGTIVSLNSYTPVCPKSDLLWLGKEPCAGPGTAKCAACVVTEAARRRRGITSRATTLHNRLGRIGLVGKELEHVDGITRYHAISPHVVEQYAALGFPESKLTMIPECYDESFVTAADGGDRTYRSDAPAVGGDDQISVLLVGRLIRSKGVQTFIRAIPTLLSRYDIEITIAGSGVYEDELRSLARTLGVDDRIDWPGFVEYDQLPALYEDADIFVYPGLLDEPFGRIFLEAMASRTPVVSSDVGSADYILGSAGTLFPPGDPIALADAFDGLIDRYEHHAAATAHQLQEFDPDRIVGSLLELYSEVAVDRQ